MSPARLVVVLLSSYLLAASAQTDSAQLLTQSGTLEPLHGDSLGFIVPLSLGKVDVGIAVSLLNGANPNFNLYCSPGFGQYIQAGPPTQGNAVWSSNFSTGGESITISANDPLFSNGTDAAPYFVCSVVNADGSITSEYTFTATSSSADQPLVSTQQQTLLDIYQSCCQPEGACEAWKAQSVNGITNYQLCSFPNQTCSGQGLLTELNMDGWGLVCAFPAADISSLTSLTSLDLSNNPNMTGNTTELWTALGAIPDLQQLMLINNSGIVGSLSAVEVDSSSICGLSGLIALDITGMQLGGGLPACLLDASSTVSSLRIGDNDITGLIPDAFATNSTLQELSAPNNHLRGSIPTTLANVTRLRKLDLSSNILSGSIPSNLAAIVGLQNLVLVDNRLTGALPASVFESATLQALDVKQNALTTLPSNWITGVNVPNTSQLINVRMSFNQFTGGFPLGLGAIPNLTALIINNNSLSGPLPTQDGLFPGLRILNASNNEFSGTIPLQLGQTGIFQLAPVSVGNNELMSHVFDLSSNQLSGTVPNYLDYDVLRNYVSSGIYLKGNNFSNGCTSELQYIPNICPATTPSPPSPPAPPATEGTQVTGSPPPQGPPLATPPPLSPIQAATTPSEISVGQTESGKSSGLGAGGIAGIVVGAVAALLLIAAIGFFAGRCTRRSANDAKMPSGAIGPDSYRVGGSGRKTSGASGQFSMPETKGDTLGRRPSGAPLLSGRMSGISLPSLPSRNSGYQHYEDAESGPSGP